MHYDTSVIFLVFNAEKFVKHANLRVLNQEKVKETVGDSYQVDSYTFCRQLAKQLSRIKLLSHKVKLWRAVLGWAAMVNMKKEIFQLIKMRFQTLVDEAK